MVALRVMLHAPTRGAAIPGRRRQGHANGGISKQRLKRVEKGEEGDQEWSPYV